MASSGHNSYSKYFRPSLRSATLILPRTGERVKRVVTLSTDAQVQAENGHGTQQHHDPNSLAQIDGQPDSPSVHTPLLGSSLRSRRIPASGVRQRVRIWQDKSWKILRQWGQFWISKTGQGILKCSLAYMLGSLGTFLPALAAFLGHQDGKHIMATVTVYFHPARSQGNMFEALVCAAVAFLYAAFVSLASMGVTVLFDDVIQKIILGHIIVLIVFCGGGLGLVGWTKQALSNPLVNVGCSLTSLAIITVLTKEGSIQAGEFSLAKVVQVLKMVVLGCFCSFVVCCLVKPISARRDLKQSLVEVTDSIGDSLALIARAFLHGSEHDLETQASHDISGLYSKRSQAMSKSLREARWEHYVYGREVEYKLEARLVQSIQRLAQNIGGLRSAARSQFSLLAQQTSGYGGTTPALSQHASTVYTREQLSQILSRDPSFSGLEAIAEADEERTFTLPQSDDESEDLDNLPSVKSPREIFDRFVDSLGPSIRSLAFTLKQILDELPYGPAPDYPITLHPRFKASLNDAIDLYSSARRDALASLYQSRDMHVSQPRALAADFEEVAASCGYFSYSLQDFAEELRTYLDVLDELQAYEESGSPRSWSWMKFWNRRQKVDERRRSADSDEPFLIVPTRTDGNHDDPAEPNLNTKPHHWKSTTPLQTPFRRRLWKAAHILRREDIKFAIKVGVGATIYALPSFIPQTRQAYGSFRGEWGLLSYMLVCSMTIGSSNTTGFARGWGTCVGAIAAILSWTVSRGNVFALMFFGWIMATGTSYITVAKGNGPLGRFIMLTYNLSCLYAYSLSVKDDDDDDDEFQGVDPDILSIAFHRVTAVLAGCLWGIIITRLIWPISARRKFHDGLGVLLLRMALIWRRDPLNMLIEDSAPHPYMDLTEELQLQQYLAHLRSLKTNAAAEFELRGPFPVDEFGRILKGVEHMLDAFHAMNVIITKDIRASPGETEILKYTKEERAYLSTRISHLFQVLASSLRLQFPLNDTLPSTENARDRLLARIFRFRRDKTRSKDIEDSDYSILYAYTLVTLQLAREIGVVGQQLQSLYGVLDEERLKLK